MFLRKLFSSKNKLAWVLVDLFIVIIGVYCAFLIQNYAEAEKNDKERNRVLTALKYELENFRFSMTQISIGMQNQAKSLNATLQKGEYSNFSDYRFIAPQYSYQVIEYSINNQNSEIVDFELYNALQVLYREIKKLEHAERLLTETARRYKTFPSNIDKTENGYKLLWTENYDNFNRFTTLIEDRGQITYRIAETSASALPIINSRLGKEKVREIEKDILVSNIDLASNENEAVFLAKKFFPDFTEDEIRTLYRETKDEPTQTKYDTIPD